MTGRERPRATASAIWNVCVSWSEQRDDLAAALDRLWQQVLDGQRSFKLYRQLKMYNDPALNPAVTPVYSCSRKSSQTGTGVRATVLPRMLSGLPG